MQKVYEKLLAHPLFISDYVVYYARVARTFYIGLAPVCVCVTQLFGLTKQKGVKKQAEEKFFCAAKVALWCKLLIT